MRSTFSLDVDMLSSILLSLGEPANFVARDGLVGLLGEGAESFLGTDVLGGKSGLVGVVAVVPAAMLGLRL